MFTNNTHKATINAFVEAKKDLIKHPYYIYNNLNATIWIRKNTSSIR